MEVKTPLKAIRAKCLDCSNGQIVEVRECVIPNCPLWPYRMGMRPKTAEKAAEKRKAIARQKPQNPKNARTEALRRQKRAHLSERRILDGTESKEV